MKVRQGFFGWVDVPKEKLPKIMALCNERKAVLISMTPQNPFQGKAYVLCEKWRDIQTGEVEWKPVPIVEKGKIQL